MSTPFEYDDTWLDDIGIPTADEIRDMMNGYYPGSPLPPRNYGEALNLFADDPVNAPNPFSFSDAPGYADYAENVPQIMVTDPENNTIPTDGNDGGVKKKYEDHSNLLTDFSTEHTHFRYNKDGTLIGRFSGKQIQDFIYNRPSSRTLTVWVRRAPALSATRFLGGNSLPTCMCSDCPIYQFEKLSPFLNQISRGDYIVAFDELERFRPERNIDPFAISGYIHFYCLERYVGLHQLAMTIGGSEDNFHQPLVLDNRKYLPNEPYEGRWRCAISDNDVKILERFRDVCLDSGGQAPSDYPTDLDFSMPGGAHDRSVLKVLHDRKWEDMKKQDKKNALERGVEGHMLHVYGGDLEVLLAAKLRAKHRPDLISPRQSDLLYAAKKYWIEYTKQSNLLKELPNKVDKGKGKETSV
ncbi:Hypothetical protein D9617_16g013880 [Elsinoe fawcettii]|nr:Hypothetical protein D9617_16g013880 [Elsinoe fawcettii]